MYDLIIVGAGPAGLTASIYASRYRLNHLVFGKVLGGQMAISSRIENYPGFRSVSGAELTQKMVKQAKSLGSQIIEREIGRIEKKNSHFLVTDQDRRVYESLTLIIASGTERRKLKIPGEEKYQGRGVSYCTTCDAPFFKGRTVAIIGGSNAAAVGALHALEFAQKVYIIYRRKPLRADPIWVEEIEDKVKQGKIEMVYNTNIVEIKGDGRKVTRVVLDSFHKGAKEIVLDGLFIEIGGVPGTALVKPLGVDLDGNGFIKVGLDMATNIPGLYAAGDITSSGALLKQITTACAQGAMAAASCYKLTRKKQAPLIRG